MSSSPEVQTPLAIVGMACLFPKADGLGAFWANVKAGVDGITEIPDTHWSPEDYFDDDAKKPDFTYAKRGGFIGTIPFDPTEFGISPSTLEATDASQLLGLVVAQRALTDAGYGPEKAFDRDRVSVILGVTGTLQLVIPLGARLGHPHWKRALTEAGIVGEQAQQIMARIADAYVPWQENSFPGLLGNVVAGRIANRLDLGGTNCVVDAACASSLSATHMAAMELAAGRTDMVVTGGVDTFNDIFMYMCFSKTPALSPSGNSRPFDANGDGTILGEGIGMVVLKRLADAERDGDTVYAVIKSLGSSSDGRGKAIYAPSDAGQAKALRAAYALAGVSPTTVELVEAHGTGTKVGDAIEVGGLTEVYGATGDAGSWCALGSVKSQIGHTKAAAGAAGMIKAALALYNKVLPPTIKVTEPLPALAPGASPFYLNTAARPWLARPEHPRRAGVSAFGFGGSNFHAVLEEHTPVKHAADWDGRVEILALSADSAAALDALIASHEVTRDWDGWRLAAQTARSAFDPGHTHRFTLVIEQDRPDVSKPLAGVRTAIAEGQTQWASPDGARYATGARPGKLAVLFPGQGAQYPGMGRDLACLFPSALATLEEAELAFGAGESLAPGDRLIDLMIPPAAFDDAGRSVQADRLRATDVAQPAIGAMSLGAYRVLEGFGLAPDMAAGHSYGELMALCVAGRLSSPALNGLSNLRGRLMAGDGGDRGSMLAVQAPLNEVTALISAQGLAVVLANKNAPAQAVVSGASADIALAETAFTAAGLRSVRLPVGAAFHSPLVADAAGPLLEGLTGVGFAAGTMPVYANTTAAPYPADAEEARALLAHQLAKPVEFVAQIQAMADAGAYTFLEVGPGARLSGLVAAILESRGHVALALDASNGRRDGVTDLARALAQLAVLGYAIDLASWQGGEAGVQPLRDRKPQRMSVPLSGANYRSTPHLPPQAPIKPVVAAAPSNGHVNGHGHGHAALATVPAAVNGAAVAISPASNGSNGHYAANGAVAVAAVQAAPAGVTPLPSPAWVAPAPSLAPAANSGLVVEALKTSQEGLMALQKLQEQTAQLHRQFLQGQEATQQTFKAMIDHQQAMFGQVLGLSAGAPAIAAVATVAAPAPALPLPLPAPVAVAPPVVTAPAPQPVPQPAPAAVVAPVPVAPIAPAPAAKPLPPSPGAARQVKDVLLAVVSDKTGYPPEMLNLDMALEADLGIDSIKRVEILSAIQAQLPEAPVVKPEHLGTLFTLRQIASFLADGLSAQPSVKAVAAPLPTPAAPVVGVDSARVEAVLVAVVSDKTGYPPEMLNLDMALEADLGIDSIKRVEILSAIQAQLPEAPVVKPEHLGTLFTLRQIAGFLAGPAAAAAVAPVAAPVAVAVAVAGHAADAVTAVVLAVVSDKTGYPPEMLNLDMALEADLGIDSIKRVEILSAIQAQLPGAPVVKPEHLGTLSTLSALISYLGVSPVPRAAAAAPAPVVAVQPAPVPAPVAPVLPAVTPVVVAPAAPPAPAWTPITGVQRLILREVALASPSERETGKLPFGAEVWVAHAGAALGRALVDRLGALSFKVSELDLLDEAAWPEPAALAGLIVVAEAWPQIGPTWAPAREDFLKACFRLVQRAESALREQGELGGAAFFTISRLDGAFGLQALDAGFDVTAGGLAGLAKTASHEWPEVVCQALDIDRRWTDDAAIAADVVRELYLDGPTEVGLREDARFSLDLEETLVGVPSGQVPLAPGDLVIVTGGARGVTAEAAVALARHSRPTLALFGRSPAPEAEPGWLAAAESDAAVKQALLAHAKETGEALPTPKQLEERFKAVLAQREVRRTLARIEAAGGKAHYISIDVRDEAAVAAALDALRAEAGPVRGLIHGAGVLADRLIADQTAEQLSAVLDTKIQGLRALLAATAADPLSVIALFSSVTGRRGRTGQVAYAMANEVLNKVAQQQAQARPDCRVVALNWGPWDGGMVTPALKRLFAEEGVGVVPLLAGAEFLVQEIAQPAGAAVEVMVLGVPEGTVLPQATAPEAVSAPAPRAVRMHTAFSRWLSPKQYPFLASHVMNGHAVLPVAVIVEWLAHGALHANPGLTFHGFDDLRVYKGVVLDEAAYGIRVTAGSAGALGDLMQVVVELRGTGENDTLHARATILLAESLPAAPAAPTLPTGLVPYGRSVQEAYREVLFHGPEFRGITHVEGIAPLAIVASLKAARAPSAWIHAPLRDTWLADPLAIDSAFQLLILWSVQELGAPCLPSRAAGYRQYRTAFPAEGVRALVRVTGQQGSQAIADVAFVDAQGDLVAELLGAECTHDASLTDAFRRNALAPSLQP